MFAVNVLILTKMFEKKRKKSFPAVFSASSQRDQANLPADPSH